MVKEFDYIFPCENTRLGDVVQYKNRKADDETLNRIFIAILRKNNIPARILRGRFASSKKTGQMIPAIGTSVESTVENDQQFVKAEFYAEAGWIPVDIISYMKSKVEF